MTREQIQHVIEKADPGRDRGGAVAIEIDRNLDVGLLGLSLDRSLAHEKPVSSRVCAPFSGVCRLCHSAARRPSRFALAQPHA